MNNPQFRESLTSALRRYFDVPKNNRIQTAYWRLARRHGNRHLQTSSQGTTVFDILRQPLFQDSKIDREHIIPLFEITKQDLAEYLPKSEQETNPKPTGYFVSANIIDVNNPTPYRPQLAYESITGESYGLIEGAYFLPPMLLTHEGQNVDTCHLLRSLFGLVVDTELPADSPWNSLTPHILEGDFDPMTLNSIQGYRQVFQITKTNNITESNVYRLLFRKGEEDYANLRALILSTLLKLKLADQTYEQYFRGVLRDVCSQIACKVFLRRSFTGRLCLRTEAQAKNLSQIVGILLKDFEGDLSSWHKNATLLLAKWIAGLETMPSSVRLASVFCLRDGGRLLLTRRSRGKPWARELIFSEDELNAHVPKRYSLDSNLGNATVAYADLPPYMKWKTTEDYDRTAFDSEDR